MIEGYWTALASIMLIILLLTGWGRKLNEHIKLTILIPTVLLIWLVSGEKWSWKMTIRHFSLTVNSSIVLISLLIIGYGLLNQPRYEKLLVVIYSAVLCLALAMLRAFMLYAPWAGATITYWHLPVVCGLLLSLLQLTIAELTLILLCGSSMAELLLMWQQQGGYNGVIAQLKWWDFISLSLISIAAMRLLLLVLRKFALFFVAQMSNRMKS